MTVEPIKITKSKFTFKTSKKRKIVKQNKIKKIFT